MHQLEEKIKILKIKLFQAVNQAVSYQEFEAIRVEFLGKKGILSDLMNQLKSFSYEDKRSVGPLLNSFKREAEEKIQAACKEVFEKKSQSDAYKKRHFDVTSYQKKIPSGHSHPLCQLTEEIENIFISMGFDLFDGPEVENDFYNFTALNIGKDHPARDMYDTLWLTNPGYLLRTHTSPVQIHAMHKEKLPIAGIATGRVFRHEAVDASHDFMFMQCEGIVIDEHITLSHLFGTVHNFLTTLLDKKKIALRTRPGFFPFVEPGIEIDMQCPFCLQGCCVCKKTGWIELFPGGMIHPNVLKEANIDPERYSGFAFGFGLTRLAMLKYGISDIRLFYEGKMKFLQQF